MSCPIFHDLLTVLRAPFPLEFAPWAKVSSGAYLLIAAAEIGDKSQLVCMTLAARHRIIPVLIGAVFAFALLNGLAVVFGALLATWIPPFILDMAVVVIFLLFGLISLFDKTNWDDVNPIKKSGHGVFLTTFLMIFLAEFGDKTQLAVAGLSVAEPPLPVWTGATLALITTSALGVWAGHAFIGKFPIRWLHRIGGMMFLAFSAYTGWHWIPIAWLSEMVN